MIRVKATREGLLGKQTASGYVIDRVVSFVALPSRKALGMWVSLWNPATNKRTIAQVLDVGPWNENDDVYVFGGQRPAAECGKDERGRLTNKAGIDLGEAAWKSLGMTDNAEIEWEFLGPRTFPDGKA